MVTVLDKPHIKPSATLLRQLERIGEIKECLGRAEYQVCGVLGLQVQLGSYHLDEPASKLSWISRNSRKDNFRRLKVTSGLDVYLDACSEAGRPDEWSILVYEPGRWEARCQPTLRLCQWLQDWGGLHPEMQLTLQIAVEEFRESGVMSLPLRQESGGRLCGKCGEEVKDLAGHIHELHDRPNAPFPLAGYLRVRGGRKSVMVIQGRGREQNMWTVPEELHRAELKHSSFRLGLSRDIDRIFSITGKSRRPLISGKYPLPNDITPLPYLADVLRKLTRGNGYFTG